MITSVLFTSLIVICFIIIYKVQHTTPKNYYKYDNEYFSVTFYIDDHYIMKITDITFYNLKCNLVKFETVEYVKLPITNKHIKVCDHIFDSDKFRLDNDFGGFYYKLYFACEEEYRKQREADKALSTNNHLLNEDSLLEDFNLNRRFLLPRQTVWVKKPYDNKDLV